MPATTPIVPRGTPGAPAGLDDFLHSEIVAKERGGVGENLKAAGEAVARGATLGGSDVLETKLGVDPNAIRERMEANPKTAAVGQMAGSAGLLYATGGLGEGLAPAAAEGALLGAGNVVTDKALGDPDMNAQKIAAEIGMGALLGLGFGAAAKGVKSLIGKSGYLKDTVPNVVTDAALDSTNEAETANAVSKLKPNAPDIVAAANEIGAPLSEGMVSADPWVQKAEDALVNGAPTYSGIKKAKLYEEGYETAQNTIKNIVGEPESEGGLSQAQLGQKIGDSLKAKIETEEAPIGALYDEIRSFTQDVPLSKQSLPRISKNIMELEPVKYDPDGPAAQLAKRMTKNLESYDSVDSVKALRKIVNNEVRNSQDYNVKFVGSQISDRLKELEKNTILRHAEAIKSSIEENVAKHGDPAIWEPQMARAQQLGDLVGKIKQADSMYAPFIKKVQTLAEMFGKKRVDGARSAINFLTEDLSPEQIAKRAFQKGDSETAKFFAKSFPEEWELVKQYQRAELRDSSVFERSGKFNTRGFIKKVDNLEPEIKDLMFSPDEVKKIDAVKTYLRSIPENFNPSGTSGMSAFREFFHHPTGAAISNARDFGIDMYIKAMTKMPPGVRPNPIETGAELANRFNTLNATRNVVERTESKISKAAKAIFTTPAGRGAALSLGTQGINSYEERVKRIASLKNDFGALGQHLSNSVDGIQDVMPNIAQSVQNAQMASVLFLDSKIPRPPANFMLSRPWQPSMGAKQKFMKYFDTVNDPVSILGSIKTGMLSAEQLEAVHATHPELYNEMRTQVMSEMDGQKAQKLPYAVKLSLAKFLGQPLDSTMLPSVIMSNQMALNQPNSPNGMSPKQQRSTQSGLAKLKGAKRMETETQGLEEEQV